MAGSRVVAFAFAAVLAGGGGGCTRNQYVDVQGWDGEVQISGTPKGFSANDPRLTRISKEINKAVGHKVRLHFENKHFPQYAGYWESLVDSELSKLPGDMRGYADQSPDAFRRVTKNLKRIDFDYDGARAKPAVTVVDGGKRVVFMLNGYGIEHGALTNALHAGYWKEQVAALDAMDPRRVPAKRHAEYLEFLEGPARSATEERAHKNEPEPGRAEVLSKLLAFEPTVRDPEVRERARELSIHLAGYFAETLGQDKHAAFLKQAGASSRYRRAERAFVDWFRTSEKKLSPEHRESAIKRLYAGSHDKQMAWPKIFPTFDPIAHGMSMLDQWAAAGFPASDKDIPDPFGAAICPAPSSDSRVKHRKYPETRGQCPRWYRTVASDPKQRARLVRHVRATKQARLVEHVTDNIIVLAQPVETMAFVRALAPDNRKWRIAARSLGQAGDTGRAPWDLAKLMWVEAAKILKTRRRNRGIALFWLAMNSGKSNANVKWENFAEQFGGLASKADFQLFLAQGPYALDQIDTVWEALGPGFSRFAMYRPMLEAYYRAELANGNARGPDFHSVKGIAFAASEHGDMKELAALTRWFEAKAKRSAKDEFATRDLLKTFGYRKESALKAAAKRAKR